MHGCQVSTQQRVIGLGQVEFLHASNLLHPERHLKLLHCTILDRSYFRENGARVKANLAHERASGGAYSQ